MKTVHAQAIRQIKRSHCAGKLPWSRSLRGNMRALASRGDTYAKSWLRAKGASIRPARTDDGHIAPPLCISCGEPTCPTKETPAPTICGLGPQGLLRHCEGMARPPSPGCLAERALWIDAVITVRTLRPIPGGGLVV